MTERQEKLKEYLTGILKLEKSTSTGEALLMEIEEFLSKPSCPAPTIVKEDLLVKLTRHRDDLLSNPDQLLILKNSICIEFQPTFFNLNKAMYPFLADAFVLTKGQSDGNEDIAGQRIGHFAVSLEGTIAKIKKKFGSTPQSIEYRTAIHMEQQIQSVQDPAFFGHW